MARGPPCPRPWPRRTESPLLVSVPDHFPSCSFAAIQRALSLFVVVDTHSRAFRQRYRFHERAVRSMARRKREDGTETAIRGWAGWPTLLRSRFSSSTKRRLPILHSYYLARTTTCAAVRSSRVDVWVGVCRSGGRAACRVRVEFARGGERIYPTFLPLLWSFFFFLYRIVFFDGYGTVRRNPCCRCWYVYASLSVDFFHFLEFSSLLEQEPDIGLFRGDYVNVGRIERW